MTFEGCRGAGPFRFEPRYDDKKQNGVERKVRSKHKNQGQKIVKEVQVV